MTSRAVEDQTHLQSLSNDARVHPRTITNFSKDPMSRRRARHRELRLIDGDRSGGITVRRLDDALLAYAHKQVGNDRGRIEMHDDGSVTIHNNSTWKTRRRAS